MPTPAEVAACRWLPDNELAVYSAEYERTGFQGGLQGYRRAGPRFTADLQTYSGRTIDVPSLFIGGKSDWGVFQNPGAFERMQSTACTQMRGAHLIDGAGHWLEQEQPDQVSRLLVQLINSRVRLFVHEAKRKVRIFSVSCRSAMNFVRESLLSHEKFGKCLAQRVCHDEFGGRDAGTNGSQPGPERIPNEAGEQRRQDIGAVPGLERRPPA